MIGLVILVILVWSFYIGYARGLVLQSFYSASAVVAMIIAGQFYRRLSSFLSLWVPYASPSQGAAVSFYPTNKLFDLDQVFYAGLAYFLVFCLAYMIARFIGVFVHLAPIWKWNKLWMRVLSGALAAALSLFVIQMGLTILSTVPLALVQNHLQGSATARFLISHMPVTSQLLRSLWVTKIIG
ncbi:CvpA family protein [Streptococcus massiliensis]|uniref:Colicin V production protein superfamily protein n=1 Tax=Streptococcus massiliensis TaxID=313439 RepID=A0A380L265_9STRE|nr:CvpA family protein [Streptococcus massiliensis]SUN77327.1 colicin V production protein superfamily protein [Streptococcus massiliensis]